MKTCNVPLPINHQDSIVCKSCCIGKSHTPPFSDSSTLYNSPLELVYSDVWGPSHYVSREGFRYYVHFTDVFSKYTWIYFMHNKSETAHHFIHFKSMVENQFGHKIKMFQSDGGKKFTCLTKLFNENGIIHRLSCPHSHQQNGTTERKHRHITEVGLTLLSSSGLPHIFWSDAFSMTIHVINRLPTPILGHKSPYEVLFNKILDYLLLRPFGCGCYPPLRPFNSHKMDFR
uniref:Retrovirus-related Pol polyprotein from transposon TNT 1-94 n=1 Tax=Cajanus cajan TaxID=3821 RepID=A0A151SEB5_CAJCA|nr:Retrovirus-related Pol polyprotein from transposon TNT 1-94 [Cajanus cajan]